MSSRLIWIVVCAALTGIVLGSAYSWISDHTHQQKAPRILRPMPSGVRPAPALPRQLGAAPARTATVPGAASPAVNPGSSAPAATPAVERPTVSASALTHWTETKGPYELDGAKFTLNIEWMCGKLDNETKHCGDPWGATAASYALLDAQGQVQSQRSFLPYEGSPDDGAMSVSAVRLAGRSHQALQIITSDSPAAPDTGEMSDFFAVHEGKLVKVAENLAIAAVGDPKGTTVLTAKLPPGDTFPVRRAGGGRYFAMISHMRFDWNAGRLLQVESNEFEVEPYLGPEREEGAIDFYAAPDFNSAPRRVRVGPVTDIKFLKVVETSTSQDARGEKVLTEWLKITLDGRVGYIAGEADFAAVGLVPLG